MFSNLLKLINPYTYINRKAKSLSMVMTQKSITKNKDKEIADKHNIFQLSFPPEKLFISISNEWEPLMIVTIVDYHTQGISILPIIEDIKTKDQYMGFTKLLPYSEAMISILRPLNPFERYTVTTGTDITDKSLITNPDGVKNEDSLSDLIKMAIDWESENSEKTDNL